MLIQDIAGGSGYQVSSTQQCNDDCQKRPDCFGFVPHTHREASDWAHWEIEGEILLARRKSLLFNRSDCMYVVNLAGAKNCKVQPGVKS